MPMLARLLPLIGLLLLTVAANTRGQPAPDAPPADDAVTRALKKAAIAAAGAKPPVADNPPLPRALSPGQATTLEVSSANRGAKLTVHTAALRDAYGKAKANGPAARLLVLDTEWENVIPLTFAHERQVATEYRIPTVSDHVYVIVNGGIAARL